MGTFAHVIENQTNYTTYLHGEAVAIGMVMANSLAQKLGLLDESEAGRIKNLLKRYALPTRYEITPIQKLFTQHFLDKKSANDSIKFILARGIGGHEIRKDIEKVVIEALRKPCLNVSYFLSVLHVKSFCRNQ